MRVVGFKNKIIFHWTLPGNCWPNKWVVQRQQRGCGWRGEGGVPNWDSVSLMAVKSGGRGRARCTFRPTCRPNASSAAAAGPSTIPPNWSLFAHQLHLFTIKGVALSTTHVLDTYCSGSRTADQMTGEALESKKYCQLKSASFATCPLRP